VIKITVI